MTGSKCATEHRWWRNGTQHTWYHVRW